MNLKPLKLVAIVFIAVIGIWRGMLFLLNSQNIADNLLLRVVSGLIVSLLVYGLITLLLFYEKEQIKTPSFTDLKSFSLGLLCWAIPAAISIFALAIAGHVTLSLQFSGASLMLQLLAVFIVVFLWEAFPEEIIRAYILSQLEKNIPFGSR